MQDLVCADEAFRKTSEAIYTHLHAAFADVEEYVQRFAPYKDTFFENHAYTDNIREIYKDVDLKVYRAEIEKYRDQVTDFENDIPYSADIGVIHVDSEDLKMRLMPSPVQCLYALKSLLPELMDAGFKTLLDELQPSSHRHGQPAHGRGVVTAKAVRSRRSIVQGTPEKLIAMASSGGADWPVPEAQKAFLVMAEENMSTPETGMQIAEGARRRIRRFAQEIKDEVPQLQKKIVAVREQLDKSSSPMRRSRRRD